MARTRRKSAAQEAPQTLEQAVALLGQYRDLVDMVDDLADERDRAIARIKGEYDLIAAPIGVRAQDMFRQLRAWWAVAGEELTGGKRKSAPLAGVIIGERTTPPSLQLPKGKNVDDIVAVLLAHFGDTYVVTSHKLDKRGVRSGIGMMRRLSPLCRAYSRIRPPYVTTSGPPISKVLL